MSHAVVAGVEDPFLNSMCVCTQSQTAWIRSHVGAVSPNRSHATSSSLSDSTYRLGNVNTIASSGRSSTGWRAASGTTGSGVDGISTTASYRIADVPVGATNRQQLFPWRSVYSWIGRSGSLQVDS